MKTSIFFLPALVVLITSCDNRPFADFIVSSPSVEVYETVYFTNLSSANADYFEWDFGDGTWSDAYNASHYYETAGFYDVTLTAFDGAGISDRRSMTIEVLTTSLYVIVEEYYTHERISDASIILYPTLTDWNNMTNPLVEGFTDAYGVARFENLNPVIYYLDVWHPYYNNYQLASEDEGWIMTDPLRRFEVNEFIAYVDYVGSVSRKDGKKIAQFKVIKMEPRMKKNVQ